MRTKLQNTIALVTWIMIAAVIILATCHKPTEEPPAAETAAQLSERIIRHKTEISQGYEKANRELQKRSDSLEQLTTQQQATIATMRRQVSQLKGTIRLKINTPLADTAAQLAQCRELGQQVEHYMDLSQQQDSLCEQLTDDLLTQVALKDNLLVNVQNELHTTNFLLNASLDHQRLMEESLLARERLLKKKKRQNKLFGAGFLLAVGTTLSLILIH